MSAARRISAVAGKEFRQLSRDRVTFGMVVMIPLIQLLLFGYAINTVVRHIPIAVVDLSLDELADRGEERRLRRIVVEEEALAREIAGRSSRKNIRGRRSVAITRTTTATVRRTRR